MIPCPKFLSGLLPAAVVTAVLTWSGDFNAPASEAHGAVPATTAAEKPVANPFPPAAGGSTIAVRPEEIDPALRDSAHLLASSNLLDTAHQTAAGKEINFEETLAAGKQLRQEKQFAQAEAAFVTIIKANAPVELQRTALLETALTAQENNQPARAQQIYTQYLEKFSDDPSAAEIYLRQGLLYRQMGVPTLALSKFYAVMTTSLRLKLDRLDYYQRLVLQAQTEIADTYYLQGKFGEAIEFLGRLLKLENPQLNKSQIVYKLIRSLACLNRHTEVVAQGEFFLAKYPAAPEAAEVRFLLAAALKQQGRTREALQQVLTLLESQQTTGTNRPANWVYWQQRTGNEIANQLYKEGDYLSALEIYRHLADLNPTAAWQLPVWYQTGLVYERLLQPQKATELYDRILAREKELDSAPRSPSLEAVLDMARWRKEHLKWQLKVEAVNASFHTFPGQTNVALSAK